ncbi:MAG: hypothetical protein R3F14_23665 [Polyangiaceae bacterium]
MGSLSSLERRGRRDSHSGQEDRVLAVDLKGFGWTDRPEGDYSPWAEVVSSSAPSCCAADHARRRRRALLGIERRPRPRARRSNPSLADRLYDAWVYEDQIPTFFRLARREAVGEALFGSITRSARTTSSLLAFYDPKILNEKLAEDVEKAMERPGTVAAALAAVRGQQFAEVEKRYRKIDKPVLLLWGREDVVTTLALLESACPKSCRTPASWSTPSAAILPDDRGHRCQQHRAREVPRRGGPVKRLTLRSSGAGLALSAALAVTASAGDARATGFTDIGDDLRSHVRSMFDLHGQFRPRRDVPQPGSRPRPHPVRPALLPCSAVGSPGPDSLCRGHAPSDRSGSLRPGGGVAAKVRLDMPDNPALGGFPDGVCVLRVDLAAKPRIRRSPQEGVWRGLPRLASSRPAGWQHMGPRHARQRR